MNHCHCRDCQRKSGTGHGSYSTFQREGLKLEGEAAHWDMIGDSGNVKTYAEQGRFARRIAGGACRTARRGKGAAHSS